VLGSNDKIDRCLQLRRPAFAVEPDIGKIPESIDAGRTAFFGQRNQEIKKASDIAMLLSGQHLAVGRLRLQ
jgi:hypothetical protein